MIYLKIYFNCHYEVILLDKQLLSHSFVLKYNFWKMLILSFQKSLVGSVFEKNVENKFFTPNITVIIELKKIKMHPILIES